MHNTSFDIQGRISDAIAVKRLILSDSALVAGIENAILVCVEALKNGGKIWFAGNGGSAADAQHLAAELSGRFYFDRPPLPAEALHVNTSYLTAMANDYGYDQVYSRMLRGAAKEGDILFAISTSGNSSNILEATKLAKSSGIKVIGLSGDTGGQLAGFCDILLNVPSSDTPRIQECHIMIGHIICEFIEKELFG